MIYLILSSEVEVMDLKKGEFKYSPLLKIGYTKDIDSRFDSYKLHNAGCKLIGERDGDFILENYMHRYFSKYKYPDREEWFYYSEEIIDKFFTLQIEDKTISKEEYVEGFKKFLISKIPTIQVLRSKYLDIILKELENIKSKVKFDKEFHKSYTINLWKDEYNREVNYINSLDFYNSLKDFPERIIPEKYPFENIANSLYNKIKITENIQYRITEKELATEALIIAFESAPDNVKISLLNKYNSDLISNNYKNDYIIVNSELKPIKNDLVYFNEVKAFHYMME